MNEKSKKGSIYVFTGDGKGKTSAALGVTVRALGARWRVCWVSLYKEESWGLSEKVLIEKFPKFEMYFLGEGFYFEGKTKDVGRSGAKVVNKTSEVEHKKSAERALELIGEKVKSGEYELVVMDEINNAITDGLVDVERVVEIVENRGETHLVLTGREVHARIVEVADLVTECKKIKHPYDEGKLAIKGLDY